MTIRSGLAASVVILAALALLVGGRPARGGEATPAGASADSPAPGAGRDSRPQGPGLDARPPGAGGDSSRQGPGRGFGPGRGGRFLDDVKAQIRASDEEWKVIGPQLRHLIFLKMIVEGGAGGEGPGRFGGPPGGGPGGPPGGGPGGPPGGGPGGPPGGAFRGPGDGWPPGGPMPGGGPGGQGFRGPGQDFPRPPGDMPGPGQDFPRPPGDMGGPMPGDPMPGGRMPGGGPRGGPGGGFGGPPPGGPGGPGGPGFGGPVSGDFALLVQARADLRAALDDPKTSPDSVREKVAVVREARRKARAALAGVAKDLLELLTADQEAVLVALGHLD